MPICAILRVEQTDIDGGALKNSAERSNEATDGSKVLPIPIVPSDDMARSGEGYDDRKFPSLTAV